MLKSSSKTVVDESFFEFGRKLTFCKAFKAFLLDKLCHEMKDVLLAYGTSYLLIITIENTRENV